MTLIELYQSQRLKSNSSEKARRLLEQTHWFTVNADFDPKTGEALPQTISMFLNKISQHTNNGILHDRLWRITEHARPSLKRLFRVLNESPRRDHAMLPVHAVRELDANSFIKLSNRPGRNIREKLAGKPYLQAVRRYQSVDLPENRLLKAFVIRLAELLELRQDFLGEEEDELLPKIHSWLQSDEAQSIDRWDNVPPNNTLLSHRNYRRVWDSWRWLQSLDNDITRDFTQFDKREKIVLLWNEYGRKYFEGEYLFAEMPVLFDYDKFEIQTWTKLPVFQKAKQIIIRSCNPLAISKPACIDLALVRPDYATTSTSSQSLNKTFIWQLWKSSDEDVPINLFDSDAAFLHPDVTSISSADLFFDKDGTFEYFDRAAHAFTSKLSETFVDNTLVWLVPDFLNDFELGIIRRNLNIQFSKATPLPRSVAALFEHVDYSKIKKGYSFAVVDYVGGKRSVTKIVTRFDPKLKKQLPETNGYYFVRSPARIIPDKEVENELRYEWKLDDITYVDKDEKWHHNIRSEKRQSRDPKILKSDPPFEDFEECINVTESPVVGGIRLHALQQRAGDIPLWQDNVPELSIKLVIDGLYKRFYLVTRGNTIKPIRGKSVPIKVQENFTLPAGKPLYQFPLYIGKNADELGYSAQLESAKFPLEVDTICKLNLTFSYGADEPYKLVFTPLDDSFVPVIADWRRIEEKVVTDALPPKYPSPMMWQNLTAFPDSKHGGPKDLIDDTVRTARNLKRWVQEDHDEAWERIRKNIKGWCRFLFISIWRDGRSITDTDCPSEFTNATREMFNTLNEIVTHNTAKERDISEFDVLFLFCATHKDIPEDYVKRIQRWVKFEKDIFTRPVGFALGDLSEEWQRNLLHDLLLKRNDFSIRVLSYAIWRNEKFVDYVSFTDLSAILKALLKRLESIKLGPLGSIGGAHDTKKELWLKGRVIAEPLELLLGLLRTRASTDTEIKMLLQPHQDITKKFAREVERITEIVTNSNINLFSRIQLNLKKPTGELTPDLLYALRLYLTGDDGANAIHITSVSENDND